MTSGFSTSSDHLTDSALVAPGDPTLDADLERVYELDRCARWLNETNVSRACLQFPDSNLVDSVAVSQRLQEKVASSSVYILGDTSYGSCCVDFVAAEHILADGIIHFGAACLSNTPAQESRVLYVFPKDVTTVVASIANKIEAEYSPAEHLLVICSCECSHIQDELCSLLAMNRTGFAINTKLLTGEQGQYASPSSRGPCSKHCRLDVEQRHQVACLGRGFCLPAGISLGACHTVYVGEDSSLLHCLLLSILGSSLKAFAPSGKLFAPSLAVSLLRRQQQYKVQCVREASTIGVVLACPGDPSLLPAVKYIRHLVASKQSPPRIYVLAIGKPNPAKLSNFPELDVFVLLACSHHPLLAPATSQQLNKEYYKPIVSLTEVELAFNSGRSDLGVDFHSLLPGGCEHQELQLQTSGEQDEADVSLLTGRLVNLKPSHLDEQAGAVVEKSYGQIIEPGQAGLVGRSWRGLDPALGQHMPVYATEGRSGIAAQYDSEPTQSPTQ